MWAVYDFDPETGTDVAYVLLADVHPGENAITIVQADLRSERGIEPSIGEAVRALALEFDRDNRLVAIEVWGASKFLPKSFLEAAAAETRPKPIAPNESLPGNV